ncbi:MAG TPA: c-type cytochrome, partial [Chthoniobacteraceae bacterium]|nr:c-type cytochrome [Chthoniobacteraceae bacterium]
FYDNWAHAGFRKTILNAIAWTSRIAVPADGVESPFFDRAAIAKHLNQPDLLTARVESADETPNYAESPYWYKPGHPLNPAEAASIKTLPGFKAERVLSVPAEFGSWTALAVDPKGRLVAAAQHEPGIYRITPPSVGEAETKVERLKGAAEKMGWSHGLLHAFDSLYVTVSEKNDTTRTGIYRLRDTDGDDQFDESRLLLGLDGAGEHGPHNLVAGPDGNSLYLMGGNGTPLPREVEKRRPVATEGIDHLMPPGYESSRHSVQGWVVRFRPDGGDFELIASGLRNSFDLAFNRAGDLFTFDSDMEWDLGAPWYRPTRICHLVSGAEFGWREGSAIWPEYFEDSVAPVVNIGPGSPTGVAFGYSTKFPAKYQNALYVCDWTFATIHAVHLKPVGAGYAAEVEEFVGGNGLPVTDMVIGGDGAMYFAVGGRRLGSAIYRVLYTGDESTARVTGDPQPDGSVQTLHELRRKLEALHARRDGKAVESAWPHLGHADRAIRFAARVAVETQPVDQWRALALSQADPDRAINALLALARQGSVADQKSVLERLATLPWGWFSNEQKLRTLRVYELALARGEDAVGDQRSAANRRLRPLFPDRDGLVNRELARLLCFLRDASVIEPLLDLMAADTGVRPQLGSGYFVRNPKYGTAVRDMLESAPLSDRMHYAQTLLWLESGWTNEQRRRYFVLIANAVKNSKGGHQYRDFWNRIREVALKQLPESQRASFESIQMDAAPLLAEGLPSPVGPGRTWTLEEALKVAERVSDSRNLDNGRKMYSAAGCGICHRFNGEGGAIGPDLSSLGQRFTVRDILDATINPSKAISDQYQVTTLELADSKSLSGRIVSRDAKHTRIATNLMRPTESIEVDNASVRRVRPEPVSTMPSGLLNALNENELLDLLAYLVSGRLVTAQ